MRWGRYGLLLLFFLAVGLLRGVLVDGLDGSRPELRIRPLEQDADPRTTELEVEAAPGSEPVPVLHLRSPLRIELDPAGALFVVEDWGAASETIRRISLDGRLLETFSPSGAPFARSVTDLAAHGDRLWVADLIGAAVHVLDRGTGQWTTESRDPKPYRLELDGEGRLVTMHVGVPELFLRRGPGAGWTSFGDLLVDPGKHALVYDGFLTRSGERLVYAGKHLGVLASFLPGSELEYLVRTLGSPPVPVVMRGEGDSRWVQPNPLPATLDVTADEETVYHLTPRQVGLAIRAVIDLYRASNGAYQRTHVLPRDQRWSSVTVGPDTLYAAGTGSIVAWPKAALLQPDGLPENRPSKNPKGRPIILIGADDAIPNDTRPPERRHAKDERPS